MDSVNHSHKAWIRATAATLLSTSLLSAGCGLSSTRVDYVDTDTYISSNDSTNHSDLTTLKISNSGGIEERTLLKLPTGSRDVDTNLADIFKDPVAIVLFPFYIMVEIFANLFNCQGKTLAPLLLQSAKLVFDVTQNSGGSLDNQVNLQLVSKPWWQTASWTQAHRFSKSGGWTQSGADLDSSFTALASTQVTTGGATTIEFDVTSYFRSLLTTTAPHYGMVLRSSSASLSSVTLASTQYATSTQRPRLVSVYTCITPTASLLERVEPEPYTYILGH